MSRKVRRLLDQFQPTNYQLHLKPDRDKMTFEGSVVIAGRKVGRPSRRISLHQKDLKILTAKLTRHDKNVAQEVKLDRINRQNSFNEVRLHSEQTIYPGQYSIELTFRGPVTRAMNGIYPCFYKHRGQDKKLIMTQFESHHAREAFPCIDEPAAKATFDLTLTSPKGETVLANTPIKKQVSSGDHQVTTFETTPVMSTYLLAFIFGEMHGLSGQSKNGTKVSTYATVAQPKEQLQFANDEAIKILDFFEDYFQTSFPLPKLDQVAVPDFEVLGMENWGLITGREIGFLNDPANPSISGLRLTDQLIAHEISHMWFGDLVTMEWWDDLWLNESFATIMESLAPDVLHPDWHEWEDFTSGRILGAANRDVYKDVQPVGVKVNDPDEIHAIFDPAIVYSKGARLLKMLQDYIGDEAFRNGLKTYFKKYAYQNTTRDELWAELSDSSGQDVGRLMTAWIEQSGTPELKVKQSRDLIKLTQQRFLLDGTDQQSIWPIPLLSDAANNLGIMRKRTETLHLNDLPLFNPEGNGHFIVTYEDEAANQKLIDMITSRRLSPSGRIISLNDMILKSQRGSHSLSDILQLIASCGSEDRDSVWTIFLRAIGLAQVLTDRDRTVEAQIRSFKAQLALGWYQKLGWKDQPGDDTNTKHLRTTALALSVSGENKDALKVALDTYAKAGSVSSLPAEQRGLIAGVAVRHGQTSYLSDLMKEYEASQNRDVQAAIAAALCSTRDVKVAKKVEKWGLHNFDIVKPQDIDAFFAYMMQNPYTRDIAWDWLKSTWPVLDKVIGEKKMEYFIWYAARPISTDDWYKKYKQFFKPKMTNLTIKRNIQIAFSEIEARIKWRRREEAGLKDYFKKFAA